MSRLSWLFSRRGALRFVGFTLGGCLVCLALALALSPYLRRWATLRMVDIYDYDKLPSRPVPKGGQSFQFPIATNGDWIARLGFTYGGQRLGDEAALSRFLAEHATTAFLVVKGGKLLDERYFNGFRRESYCKSFSVSKSVLSALIGIALAEHLIGSLDDPVTQYLPDMKDPRFAQVTLRHCLNTTAGIKYTRGSRPWALQPWMYYTTDARHFVRSVQLIHDPGHSFSTEDLSPLILGCVLEKALERHPSIRTISDYLAEKIWKPMGAEYDALWNLDHAQTGLEKTESGFTARAIDLTKFALLYLQEGRWGQTQLVPAAWIKESTTLAAQETGPNIWPTGFYKHLWWGHNIAGGRRADFYANGHFGQRLYLSPARDLVLVRLGYDNHGVDWVDFLASLAQAFDQVGEQTKK